MRFKRVRNWAPAALAGAVWLSGCTRDSVRQALAAQQRADAIQQAVFDRQHDGLRVLLYRDLETRLATSGVPLNDGQCAALNQAWNERDLIEHWRIQMERAKALRLAGVDAKLFSDQSVVDLLVRGAEARYDRARQSVARELGEAAVQTEAPPPTAAESSRP